jgi:starch phosphorylase
LLKGYRVISARLYAGDPEQRLRQEIVLAIGGAEVLETLGVKCAVTHLNKGHPALADGKRIHSKVLYKGFKTRVRELDSFFSDY